MENFYSINLQNAQIKNIPKNYKMAENWNFEGVQMLRSVIYKSWKH